MHFVGLPSPSPKREFHISQQQQSSSFSTAPNLPPPCSDLYDLVLDMNWPAVIRHCHNHPQDALFQEGDTQETPLYLACQWNPPTEVLQVLIATNPQALKVTAREHRDLPLHMLCRYAATPLEAIQACVTSYPASAFQTTKYGKTALYVLWDHGRPDCMKGAAIVTAALGEESPPPSNQYTSEEQQKVQIFWEKMEVLVEAVARTRQQSLDYHKDSVVLTSDSVTFPTVDDAATPANENNHDGSKSNDLEVLYHVHAAVFLGTLGCPDEVLEYICRRYPRQVSQRDKTGQLPLHLAVGPRQWSSSRRKYKPREQASIKLLLQIYPEAATQQFYATVGGNGEGSSMDNSPHTQATKGVFHNYNNHDNGRYPLHIALVHRHTWEGGVQELFEAAPGILSAREPLTQLYPFQLAAVPVQENLTVDVTTIWELLRRRTELLSMR